MIPVGGIDVTAVTNATISDWPSDYMWGFPPVALGAEGSGDNMMYGAPVVISEIQTASSTDPNGEFIELYNRADINFDLNNWSIQYRDGSSGVISAADLTGGSIPAKGFYLITKSGYNIGTPGDAAYSFALCSTSSVSNGTIDNTCAITCDNGYTLNGNSCVSSGGGGGTVSPTYCSSVEYDEWQTTCASGWQYRNVKSRTPSNCALTTQQESQRKRQCGAESETEETTEPTIEETEETPQNIITETKEAVKEAADTAKETAVDFAKQIAEIASEAAEVIKAKVQSILSLMGLKRSIDAEAEAASKYARALEAGVENITTETHYALTNFVAYGTPTTLKLGAGERAGVVNSYKAAFGKLPSTEEEWQDVIKIANGRWPSERNDLSEANAEAAFRKIYLRAPDRSNPHDDAAVTVIAYGLRPANRNLDSERAAIRIFKAIYGYNPSSATAWDIVRAIAYSGATR
jgi:hypothetical protein